MEEKDYQTAKEKVEAYEAHIERIRELLIFVKKLEKAVRSASEGYEHEISIHLDPQIEESEGLAFTTNDEAQLDTMQEITKCIYHEVEYREGKRAKL